MTELKLEKKVRAYMEAHGMPLGGRILVACSGGADSVALLHLLKEMDGIETVCAHFNHCIRGAESDRDEEFVRELCRNWGVECYSGRGDVPGFAEQNGLGIEEAARELRYRFLRETAKTAGCASIATAHTAGDNAETVLFHLIRGAGTRGLCGIPPVREDLIRPLLSVTRSEIEDYLAARGLPHVEDSSNADTRYARNALRRDILPALEAINAGAAAHITAAAELLREDEDYLDGLASELIETYYANDAFPIAALLDAPKPVAMRVLRRLTDSPGREHLDRLYAFCQSGRDRAALDLPSGRVRKEGVFLRFGPEEAQATVPRRALQVGQTLFLPEIRRQIYCTETDYTKEIHNSFNTFYFKSENICGTLYVASRAAGDAIRFAGRGCTKSVRKLFSEACVPQAERARRLVFSDERGVVAVEGFAAVAERCVPEPGMKAVKIEIL